ncbi:YceD family protein [Sporolituus thermophilus]|uniref:DUF177 domain-containing protein n=1 Tax=Sporolituus thermophilus DSM 23256 TaxID=1123285 RepID=A0A1G7NSW4_9FIRM|nr:DUF177 domain-containing protein [Sporolituus thermophilus]SDF77023.1 uncharacterized protein SAMN05660235_02688 [Sporolituus thermophilus DSM 23256]
MMKIDISQVKQEAGGRRSFYFVTSAPELGLPEEEFGWDGGDIIVEGEVANNGQFLEIRGSIKAKARYDCNRCLKPFTMAMEIPFTEKYFTPGFLPDEDAASYEGNEIDITDLLRENLLLAEPLKPLCSESCRGLCPVCGADLNEKDCSCEKGSVDPRLAVLQQLFKKE